MKYWIFLLLSLFVLAACAVETNDELEVQPPQAPSAPGEENLAGEAYFTESDFDSSVGYAPPWDVFNNNVQVISASTEEISAELTSDSTLWVYFDEPSSADFLLTYNTVHVFNAETQDWTQHSLDGKATNFPNFIQEDAVGYIPLDAFGVGDNFIIGYFCTSIEEIPNTNRGAYACGCTDSDLSTCGKWNIQRITVNEQTIGDQCGDGVCQDTESVATCRADCVAGPLLPGMFEDDVNDDDTRDDENGYPGIVEFSLGGEIIEYSDYAGQNTLGSVEVNREHIEDGRVDIYATVQNNEVRLHNIDYFLDADGYAGQDLYVQNGQLLSQHLDEPEGLIGIYDLYFETDLPPSTPTISIEPNGDDEYELTFTNDRGVTYRGIPYAEAVSADTVVFGDTDDDLFFYERYADGDDNNVREEMFPIGEDDYLLLTSGGSTYALQFTGIDRTKSVIQMQRLSDGQTTEYQYGAPYTGFPAAEPRNLFANPSGVMTIGGIDHKFWLYLPENQEEPAPMLAVDLNADGEIAKNYIGDSPIWDDKGQIVEEMVSYQIAGTEVIFSDSANPAGGDWTMFFAVPHTQMQNQEAQKVKISFTTSRSAELDLSLPSESDRGQYAGVWMLEYPDNLVDGVWAMNGYGTSFRSVDSVDEADPLWIHHPKSQILPKVTIPLDPTDPLRGIPVSEHALGSLHLGQQLGNLNLLIDLGSFIGSSRTCTARGCTNVHEKIDFSTSESSVMLAEDDNDLTELFYVVPEDTPVLRHGLEFESDLISDINDREIEDFISEVFLMLGRYFVILDARIDTSNDLMKMRMLTPEIIDVLQKDERKSYTLNGLDYEVVPTIVSSDGKVVLEINGEATDLLEKGDFDTLSDGTLVTITEVIPGTDVDDNHSNFTAQNFQLFPISYVITEQEINFFYANIELGHKGTGSISDVEVTMAIEELGLEDTKTIPSMLATETHVFMDQFVLNIPDSTPSGIYQVKLYANGVLLESQSRYIANLADVVCDDSDDLDFNTKGTVTLSTSDGDFESQTDTCCTNCNTAPSFDGTHVSEYKCVNGLLEREVFDCRENGCTDGGCIVTVEESPGSTDDAKDANNQQPNSGTGGGSGDGGKNEGAGGALV